MADPPPLMQPLYYIQAAAFKGAGQFKYPQSRRNRILALAGLFVENVYDRPTSFN